MVLNPKGISTLGLFAPEAESNYSNTIYPLRRSSSTTLVNKTELLLENKYLQI